MNWPDDEASEIKTPPSPHRAANPLKAAQEA
jgi:hypothetical protein